jgi:heme exporter protein D
MQWGNLENFLAMGGYGFYVWSAYGMTVALIAVELWLMRARRKAIVTDLAREAKIRKNSEELQ